MIGDEIRACWEAGPSAIADAGGSPVAAGPAAAAPRADRLEFIDVDRAAGTDRDVGADRGSGPTATAHLPAPPEPGWNLWGDLER